MPRSRVTNYQLAMVKGRCSYRFQAEGAGLTNWIPVSTPDFAAVAAIFATNNVIFDSDAAAFVAGSSGGAPMLAAEMTLPLVAKKKAVAKKYLSKPKTKSKNK